MKVKRYSAYEVPCTYTKRGNPVIQEVVLASDYDALLALARMLRKLAKELWQSEDDSNLVSVMRESAWLEE